MQKGRMMCAGLLAAGLSSGIACAANELPSDAPALAGVVAAIPQTESVIGIRTRAALSTVSEALDRRIQKTFSGDSNGPDSCKEIRAFGRLVKRICVGTHYSFTATRTAPVVVTDVGGKLHLATSVAVSGKGGFRGDLPRALSLSAKNFNAAANVSADVDIHLSGNWCPSVSAQLHYDWTQNPRVEIISRTWVDVSGQVNGKVNDALSDIQNQIASSIPCERIQAEAAKAWHVYDIPVAIPGEPALHLSIIPTAAGTSGLIVDPNEIRLAVGLKAKTDVSTQPPTAADTHLPALGSVPDAAGQLSVYLPVHAPYEALAQGANNSLKGQSFDFNAAGGSGAVKINNVAIYPSNGDLAIAFEFGVHFAGHIPDVSGKVYATAKPVVGPEGQTIGITGLTYRVSLDNLLWAAISYVFKGDIQWLMQRDAKINLAPRIAEGLSKLQTALSDPTKTKGVQIVLGSPTVHVQSVVPEREALTAIVRFGGTLDTTITDMAIAQ